MAQMNVQEKIESIQFRNDSLMVLILTFILVDKSLDTCVFVIFFPLGMCNIHVCVLLVLTQCLPYAVQMLSLLLERTSPSL